MQLSFVFGRQEGTLVLHQTIIYVRYEGEVWWKVFQTKILSFLSCPSLLRKFNNNGLWGRLMDVRIVFTDMAMEAGTAALKDAGILYQDVEAVVASYCYGEPTSGKVQVAVKF